MTFQPPSDDSIFVRLFNRILGRSGKRTHKQAVRRNLRMESLEGRSLLASDLGQITGLIFRDVTGNGFNAGEQVVGASVQLYLDDSDGVFEPGAGDVLQATDTTDANGEYLFDSLSSGDYWVAQIAQTIGADTLSAQQTLVNISALEAQGVLGTLIDDFTTEAPTVTALDPVGSIDTDTADIAPGETIGDERDFLVELTASDGAGEQVELTVAGQKLDLNPSIQGQGRYVVTWDGDDNDGAVLNAVGLGGIDLTDAGDSTAIVLEDLLVDQAGGQARIRVYTDAVNFSERTIAITANITQDLLFVYADFTAVGGTGADFTNVGAIELQILATANSMDGGLDLLRAIGPSIEVVDFDNPLIGDLELTKTVDDASPNVGQNITFTITVDNLGPDQATNVEVTDLLPAGLTFVSSNPSQGAYVAGTGIWTVGTINANSDATLQIVATVTAAVLALPGRSVTNSAEITASDQPDPDSTPNNDIPAEDDQDSVAVTVPQIDLSLLKSVDDSTPNRNQNVTFTLTLANAGPDQATGVAVTDLLPTGLTFVSSNPSVGTYNSGTGVWTVGALNGGGTATLQIVATVVGATPLTPTITNNAQVTAANENDVNSTVNNGIGNGENDQASVVLDLNVVDLSLLKSVDDNTPNRNQNVTFTLTLANAGPDAATNVAVTDLLPAGLTFVSSNPSVGTYASGTGIWTVGSLASGANATLQIVATVAGTAPLTPTITNNAQVTAADGFDPNSTVNNGIGNGEDDQASVVLDLNVIDLSLTKTVDDSTPNRNQNVTFTLTLANGGPDLATGVAVTDLLPSGLTFVSSTPSVGTYASGTGIWTVGSLASGANATLQIVATVAGATPFTGTITNDAQVTAANEFDSDSTVNNGIGNGEDDQASAALDLNVADLSLTKTVDDSTPNRNQNVTFTITVSNAGPDSATAVAVQDLLPAGLTFVSSNPSQGSYVSGTGVWTVGTINNGANATLQIVATVTSAASIINTAQVSANDTFDTDSTPANSLASEDDQASVTLTPNVADLSLTKTVNDNTPQIGDNVTFTVTVANAGPTQATNVSVLDLLPAGLTFVSSTPSQGAYVSGTGVWTVGSINSGANATLQIVATVTTAAAITNIAQVSAADQFDGDSTPNNSIATEDDQDSESLNVTALSKKPCIVR
jgi:uncharacterized repeat protein (TIGR01451 family)